MKNHYSMQEDPASSLLKIASFSLSGAQASFESPTASLISDPIISWNPEGSVVPIVKAYEGEFWVTL